jgi:hypothetical protein
MRPDLSQMAASGARLRRQRLKLAPRRSDGKDFRYAESTESSGKSGLRCASRSRRPIRPAVNGGATSQSPVNGAEGVFSPVHGALACRPVLEHGPSRGRAPTSRGTPPPDAWGNLALTGLRRFVIAPSKSPPRTHLGIGRRHGPALSTAAKVSPGETGSAGSARETLSPTGGARLGVIPRNRRESWAGRQQRGWC